jgi:uncharacterized protein
MILKRELSKIVKAQQPELAKDLGIAREVEVKLLQKFVSIISGIRRCGKSTFARQLLQNFETVYYLNFEDIHLARFELEDFLKLEEIFRAEMGSDGVFFFDEIQLVQNWEQYIRQLVDKNERVLITGSNASMLSHELGSRLTGRHLSKQLYPFSYREFLGLKSRDHSITLFEDYLKNGGFPEFLKIGDTDILRHLFQDIFYRDILQQNDLRNENAVKSLLSYLISNIGKITSFTSLKQIAEVGSVNTITQLMHHFENAYFMFSLRKWDYSIKKQLLNPKKVYCIDNGFITVNSFSFTENKGRLLENLVFIELKRRNEEVYYFKEKGECDFVIKKGNAITEAIQVCYDLNPDNQQREITGLTEALKSLELREGKILTFDQEDHFTQNGFLISVIPVWKWLPGF